MREYLKKLDKGTLGFYEREYLDRDFQVIEINVNNEDIERINFLLENGYKVTRVNKKSYDMSKKIIEKKSFRISLTESCNYKCFFCHEEGMDMNATRKKKGMEAIYKTSLDAIRNGFLDITFTRGEPLIKWEWIIEFLKRYNSLSLRPEITIVTNGVLINDALLDSINKYEGKFKFNFSMHHTNKEKYYDIVVPKNKENFDIVTENIKKIVERKINIKLNFVILNEINNSREDLEFILDYAVKNRVDCIKFLEFLVTDKLLDKYNYYFTLESLYARIKDLLTLERENLRTKYYKYKDTDLIVELSHCTCGIGCSKCILAKDVTVTSELKYFPCFFRSNKGFNITDDFNGSIEEGENTIKKFAQEFGNKTPFKVSGEKYIDKRIDYIYTLENSKKNEFLNKLEYYCYYSNNK